MRALRPRFNAVATAENAPLPEPDPRQQTLFGAAWTTSSLARLAALDGLHSLTFFETTGPRGLLDATNVFPMFHVFAALADGEKILPARSTHPLLLDGFCTIGRDGLHRWLVANLTAFPQRIRIAGAGSSARVRLLSESSAAKHQTPFGILELELNPYACAQIIVEN